MYKTLLFAIRNRLIVFFVFIYVHILIKKCGNFFYGPQRVTDPNTPI